DRHFAGFPVEFGAEFVHGARVKTWEWIERLGLRTMHWQKAEDSWVRLADGQRLTMTEARRLSRAFDLTRGWDLPDVPARPHESPRRPLDARLALEPRGRRQRGSQDARRLRRHHRGARYRPRHRHRHRRHTRCRHV